MFCFTADHGIGRYFWVFGYCNIKPCIGDLFAFRRMDVYAETVAEKLQTFALQAKNSITAADILFRGELDGGK